MSITSTVAFNKLCDHGSNLSDFLDELKLLSFKFYS